MCPPNTTGVPMRGEIWKYRDTHREGRPLQTQLQRAEGRREVGGGREGSHAPQAKERLGHRSPRPREGRSGVGGSVERGSSGTSGLRFQPPAWGNETLLLSHLLARSTLLGKPRERGTRIYFNARGTT